MWITFHPKSRSGAQHRKPTVDCSAGGADARLFESRRCGYNTIIACDLNGQQNIQERVDG